MSDKRKRRKELVRFTKKKLVLIGLILFMIPTTAMGAYQAQQTIAAQKSNIKTAQAESKHPFRLGLGAISYGFSKLTGTKVHGSGHDFSRYKSSIRKTGWGLGSASRQQVEIAKLKKTNNKAYKKITGAIKNGKVKLGTVQGEKDVQSMLDSADSQYANQTKQDADQENAKEASEASDNSGGDSSFKSKIAEALLHVFWSKGIGKWVMRNGATGTVFTYDPINIDDGSWENLENAQVSQQLSDKVNNSPSLLMFPATAYSSKMASVIDALRPPMMAFAAIVLVVAVIMGGTQLGLGTTFQAASGRLGAYRKLTDVIISVAAIASIPMFIRMLLQLDGALLELFATYMESVQVGNGSLMTVALQLGADEASIKTLTKGTWLGSGFAAVIFIIIYLYTAIGIAIWVKYYYFVRMIAFIILMILGPVFIALWPFGFGKARTMNWLRDVVGTIFIQPIHAFVLTLMATLMAINSDTFGSLVSNASKNQSGQNKVDVMNNANTEAGVEAAADNLNGLTSAMTVAGNFEMIVMGFIILILFQPVSKSIAGLFGIGSSMLDNIHSSTSRTLTTGAAIAGTAAVGLGAGALAGSAGLLHGAKAATSAAKAKAALKGGNSFGARALARRQALAKNAQLKSVQQKRKAKRDLARAGGILGTNAGTLMGAGIGAGSGSVWAMTGLSAAGGEIGKRAANLVTNGTGLLSLGLKRANAWRNQQSQAIDANNISNATNKSLAAAAKARVDKNPGPLNEITDQINKNSNLSPGDKAAALQNVQALQAAAGNFTPDAQAMKSRAQMEMRKDRSGNYVPNASVQSMSKGIIDGLTDGASYDKAYGGPPQNFQQLQDKAEAVGFDLSAWQSAHANDSSLGNDQAKLLQANKAMNNMKPNIVSAMQQAAGIGGAATDDIITSFGANELNQAVHQAEEDYNNSLAGNFDTPADFAAFQQTSEYREGLLKAQNKAKQQAFINSNGGVVSHTDMSNNSAFNRSIIDGDRYANDLADRLSGLYVKPELKDQLVGIPNQLDGSSMVSDVPIGHGNSAKVINQDLFNQMEEQRAYTLRSQGVKNSAGKPVTRADMASVYSPGVLDSPTGAFGTPGEYRDHFGNQNRAGYADYNQTAQEWDELRNLTSNATRGIGSAFDERVGSYLGLGGTGTRGHGGHYSSGNMASAAPEYNPYADAVNASSLSMDDVRQMVPIVKNDRGEPVGTSPGSIRVVYGNNYSMLQARDPSGEYHQVGTLGSGDPSLGAGDVAYQDADLTPTGDLVMRTDPQTHRPSMPYRMSGESRIPVSLPGGTADLGQFFSPEESYISQNALARGPYAKSSYKGMYNAPELQRALQNDAHVYGDNYGGYSDIQVRGTYDGMVMTGRDPRDGQTKVMSRVYDNSIWGNMENGYEFSIPVKESHGEFQIDSAKPMNVFASSGTLTDPQRLDNMRQELQNMCRSNQKGIQSTINDVILKPTKPNSRAFKYRNQPGYSVSGLKSFTEDFDW